jgi:hypothetical protein
LLVEYSKRAEVTVPSLDDWEKDWQENPQSNVQPKLMPVDFRPPLASLAQSNQMTARRRKNAAKLKIRVDRDCFAGEVAGRLLEEKRQPARFTIEAFNYGCCTGPINGVRTGLASP